MSGFIYLTHLREFINSNQEIYKLGKSGKLDRSRLYGYPKGSNTILTLFVKNHHKAEEELLQLFSDKFTKMNNIGREYFERWGNDTKKPPVWRFHTRGNKFV